MKIEIVAVGKVKTRETRRLTRDYLDRIERYVPAEVIEVSPGKGGDEGARKEKEAADLMSAASEDGVWVALDERGKIPDSEGFATWVDQQMIAGTRYVTFFIGGAYGLDAELRRQCQWTFSLSRLTFPHELARLVLAEQVYRAMTIVRNEPYHK